MVSEKIKIHDPYRIEMKFDYPISEKNKTSYVTNTYFFISNSLDINKDSYPKRLFYRDVHNYIRLQTPKFTFKNILQNKKNPYLILKNTLISKNIRVKSKKEQIKIFTSIVKSSLRDHVFETEVITQKQVDEYVEFSYKITKKFRALKPMIHSAELKNTYLHADEYMSVLIEKYAINIIEDSKKIITKKLRKLIKDEYKYRKNKKFISIPKNKSDNENALLHRGFLKKSIGRILFLDTKTRQPDFLVEQVIFGVAAGVAMMFATAVSFITMQKFGNLTTSFFIALVVAYIFKDRIKEFIRHYMRGKISKYVDDTKMNIYSSPHNQIGIIKESMDFLHKKKVPDYILKARNKDSTTELKKIWENERIIKYRKTITLFSHKFDNIYQHLKICGINDIMRFNLTSFFRNVDKPKKPLYVVKNDKIGKVYCDKLYHMNVIFTTELENQTALSHYLISFTKNGIVKIDVLE